MWDMRPIRSTWLLLGAVVTEVAGTLALRVSEGFTAPLPTLGTLVGYGVSLWLFARALDGGGLTLGVAYATLTGLGLAAATAASTFVFGDPLTAVQPVGLLVLGAGVVVVQTTGPAAAGEPS